MPTPVAHGLAGIAVARVWNGTKPLLLASVVSACLPDLDFGISFLMGRNYHHYFTHSIGFNLLFVSAVYLWARLVHRARPLRDAAMLGSSYLSHVVLDMLSKDTAAPYGVELFWPISERFYISPVLLFDDIWRGSLPELLSLHNWLAIAREVLIVGPPLALILFWRRRQLE